MQGLADGYFILPSTIGAYLAQADFDAVSSRQPEFKEAAGDASARIQRLLSINGNRTVDDFHKELGRILWDFCGMSRNDQGLKKARGLIQALREEFWQNAIVPGSDQEFNQSLEKAGRVADFLEFAELMVIDALARKESCGCHFNEAYQTEENEAKRDDENFCHVAAWEYSAEDEEPALHKEQLEFENVELSQRSYK